MGRGYIWGKTIPLLKHYAILGSGADTFVIAFPNYDYVSMFNGGYGTCFRLKKYDLMAFVGAGVLAGSAGCMVVQIINDSSITVAPVYWTMIGVGLAVFRNLRRGELYVPKGAA